MTLRIYRNEYEPSTLKYILDNFKIIEKSDRTVTIEGELNELEKVMMGVHASEDDFKKLFPDFLTKPEREQFTRDELYELKEEFLKKMLKIAHKGEWTEQVSNAWAIYENSLEEVLTA